VSRIDDEEDAESVRLFRAELRQIERRDYVHPGDSTRAAILRSCIIGIETGESVVRNLGMGYFRPKS
jgi:hypothetical protein